MKSACVGLALQTEDTNRRHKEKTQREDTNRRHKQKTHYQEYCRHQKIAACKKFSHKSAGF